jgi:hypothetical protein
MKTEQPILITSIELTTDITKNLCVTHEGNIAEEGDSFIGVCNADTLNGEEAPVMVSGIALCVSSAAISKGFKVVTFDNGSVAANTATTFMTNHVGIALDAATGADELIRVLLK